MIASDRQARQPRQSRLVAHFLNPAFIAVIVRTCIAEYEQVRREPMPWLLLFVAVPLVVHGPSRRALPRDTRTHLSTWIARNPTIVAGFGERAHALVPSVRAGLRYGVRCGVLTLVNDAVSTEAGRDRVSGSLVEITRASGLVGRWFAKLDRPSTAYALLGVTP